MLEIRIIQQERFCRRVNIGGLAGRPCALRDRRARGRLCRPRGRSSNSYRYRAPRGICRGLGRLRGGLHGGTRVRTGRTPALDVPADEIREVYELSAYSLGVLLVVGERRDRAKVRLGAKGRGGGEREREIL